MSMTRFLDLVRPAAGTALMSEWLTGTAARSRLAADTMVGEWAAAGTPSGRLAQHVFLSTDGTGLLFYAQWTSDEVHLAWARAHRAGAVSHVDTLVPGIERPGLTRTRLTRSVVHDPDRPVGVYVVSTMAADGDGLSAAVAPAPGLLAAHVHLTPDGEQAVVVAEWTDTAAHEAAAPGAVAPGAVGHRRYTLHRAFEDDRRDPVAPKGVPGSAG